MQKSHNLDFLRACAVLLVLADHTLTQAAGVEWLGYWNVEWLGRLGVLFFFVHTCCVLMMSLERHRAGGIFGRFYLRRVFRIYPLAILAVLTALIANVAPGLKAWEWVSNFALIQNLTGANDSFTALWSLPLEVQMYLFLPLCFLLAVRYKTIWPLLGLWALSTFVALSPIGQFLPIPFPAFLPGVIAYALMTRTAARLPGWSWPLALLLLAAAFELHPSWRWPAWTTCLVLGLAIPQFRPIANARVNAVSATIARYSYGIYLSHSLLMDWFHPTARFIPVYLLAVAVISMVAYHAIERPMIRLASRILDRKDAKPVPVTQPA